MVTKLRGSLRREVPIKGRAYVVTISTDGLKLTEKGRRNGFELAWNDLVSGEAALAVALNASVGVAPPPRVREPKAKRIGGPRKVTKAPRPDRKR
jgi:hypothetical protein